MPVVDSLVPLRRTADLVVRAQADETLVLDTRTDTAHCLPADVARVWDACTAGRTLADVAAAAGVDEVVAASSIDQLHDAGLLETGRGLDRRRFLKRTAIIGGSAAALPLIQSVIAPAVTAAASPPKVATATKTGCGSANRLQYTLTLSGFTPNGTVFVTVLYKGSVTDPIGPITLDGTGSSTTSQLTSAAVPSDTTATVSVYSDAAHTNLLYTGPNTVWTKC